MSAVPPRVDPGAWTPGWRGAADRPAAGLSRSRGPPIGRRLSALPPLTTSWEIEKSVPARPGREGRAIPAPGRRLRRTLRRVLNAASIADRLKILLQMSLVLAHGGGRRVIRVGRFAGQYAKPLNDRGDPRRRDVAGVPGRQRQRAGLRPGSRTSGSRKTASRTCPQPAITLNFIRSLVDGLRRSPPSGVLEPRFRPALSARRGVPGDGGVDRRERCDSWSRWRAPR